MFTSLTWDKLRISQRVLQRKRSLSVYVKSVCVLHLTMEKNVTILIEANAKRIIDFLLDRQPTRQTIKTCQFYLFFLNTRIFSEMYYFTYLDCIEYQRQHSLKKMSNFVLYSNLLMFNESNIIPIKIKTTTLHVMETWK